MSPVCPLIRQPGLAGTPLPWAVGGAGCLGRGGLPWAEPASWAGPAAVGGAARVTRPLCDASPSPQGRAGLAGEQPFAGSAAGLAAAGTAGAAGGRGPERPARPAGPARCSAAPPLVSQMYCSPCPAPGGTNTGLELMQRNGSHHRCLWGLVPVPPASSLARGSELACGHRVSMAALPCAPAPPSPLPRAGHPGPGQGSGRSGRTLQGGSVLATLAASSGQGAVTVQGACKGHRGSHGVGALRLVPDACVTSQWRRSS